MISIPRGICEQKVVKTIVSGTKHNTRDHKPALFSNKTYLQYDLSFS